MSVARALGALVQALILGVLLAFALGRLLAEGNEVRVFQYQAY